MNAQLSVSEIIENASQLNRRDFESLVGKLNYLRAQRIVPSLSKQESDLLKKINEGFPQDKWKRLAFLDDKMEFDNLTENEANESLVLAEELEAYTVQRFTYLKKLAIFRGVTIEKLLIDLNITPV
jgi:hypothetical protein